MFCLEKNRGYFVPRKVREYHQRLLDRCETSSLCCERLARKEYLDCPDQDPDDLVLIDNSSSGANSVFKAVSEENGAVVLLLSTSAKATSFTST